MREIDKLKKRLKNVNPNVTEYRMTIAEARNLIKEFDDLQKPVVVEKVITQPTPIVREIIMDGGSL